MPASEPERVEKPFTLGQMASPGGRRRRIRTIAALVAAALLLMGGTIAATLWLSSRDDPPTDARPTAATSPVATTPTATRPSDTNAAKACTDIKRANAGNAFQHDPDAMLAIAATAWASDEPSVRAASISLRTSAEIAKAAKGQSDGTRRLIELGTAAINLETACTLAGYYR